MPSAVLLPGTVIQAFRCNSCANLHIVVKAEGVTPAIVINTNLPANEWARILMCDPEFAFEAAQILKTKQTKG